MTSVQIIIVAIVFWCTLFLLTTAHSVARVLRRRQRRPIQAAYQEPYMGWSPPYIEEMPLTTAAPKRIAALKLRIDLQHEDEPIKVVETHYELDPRMADFNTVCGNCGGRGHFECFHI